MGCVPFAVAEVGHDASVCVSQLEVVKVPEMLLLTETYIIGNDEVMLHIYV